MNRVTTYILLLVFLAFTGNIQAQEPEKTPTTQVLVFSKTAGYRHQSISNGVKMMYELAQPEKWTITATENAELFTPEFLHNFDVIVFLSPTQDILNEQQQKAFERFMEGGKGFVGIHAATDCEFDWPFYSHLTGAQFSTHPPAQEATVIFEDNDHPAMAPFRDMKSYTTFDEWYSFKENPRGKVHVLAHLDEYSIKKEQNKDWAMGDHPVIWYQEFNGMRSFYTVFGHTAEAFDDPNIRAHIAGAVNWAAHKAE